MFVIEVAVTARWKGEGSGPMSVPSAQCLLIPPVTPPVINARPITAKEFIPSQTSLANLDTALGVAATALGVDIAAALIANGVDATLYGWQTGNP